MSDIIVPYIDEDLSRQFFQRLCEIGFNGSWYNMKTAVVDYAYSSIPLPSEEDEDCEETCDVVDDLKYEIENLESKISEIENEKEKLKEEIEEQKKMVNKVINNYDKLLNDHENLKDNSVIFSMGD